MLAGVNKESSILTKFGVWTAITAGSLGLISCDHPKISGNKDPELPKKLSQVKNRNIALKSQLEKVRSDKINQLLHSLMASIQPSLYSLQKEQNILHNRSLKVYEKLLSPKQLSNKFNYGTENNFKLEQGLIDILTRGEKIKRDSNEQATLISNILLNKIKSLVPKFDNKQLNNKSAIKKYMQKLKELKLKINNLDAIYILIFKAEGHINSTNHRLILKNLQNLDDVISANLNATADMVGYYQSINKLLSILKTKITLSTSDK